MPTDAIVTITAEVCGLPEDNVRACVRGGVPVLDFVGAHRLPALFQAIYRHTGVRLPDSALTLGTLAELSNCVIDQAAFDLAACPHTLM